MTPGAPAWGRRRLDATSVARDSRCRFLVALLLVVLIGVSMLARHASGAEGRQAVEADPRLAEIRAELAAKVASGELASLAIGVVDNGRIIWAEALGWADREKQRKASVDTRYGIASVGKSMVAVVVLQLVEQGRLSLDTPVGPLLPADAIDRASMPGSPSLRQLLDMSGGIAHGAYTYTNGQAPAPGLAEHRRALQAFAPGTVFHYSNFSIDLVDRALEAKTGVTFEDLLRKRLFEPLGMSRCALEPAADLAVPAKRYFSDGSAVGEIAAWPRSSRRIHCSLIDLLRYSAFHLQTPLGGQQRVLSTRGISRMHEERSGLPGAHMALGIASIDVGEDRRWLITSGQDMGVQASITLLPWRRLGVVVLTNSSGNDADEIGIRVADVLAPGFASQAVAAIGAFEGHTRDWHADADWTGHWHGSIDTARGARDLSLEFQPDGDIHVLLDGQYPTLLSEARFREGLLSGVFLGRLALDESAEAEHRIELSLVRRRSRIEGFAVANFRNAHGKFELPARVVLSRVLTDDPRP